MKITAVIPARYGSTRFPGKVLARIQGKPMVQWVYEKAKAASLVNEVLVATDDERVAEAVRSFGGEVRMTSKAHPSGTDRIAEVAKDLSSDILINVQGDEPGLEPYHIDLVADSLLKDPEASMATLASRIMEEGERGNPNVVKVVFDQKGYALYFSRFAIPFNRDGLSQADLYKHIGLYSYRREFILKFINLPPTPLEKMECLEQLRVLENGYKIRVAVTDYSGVGVDTPEDLERISKINLTY
jgi:3-deoxy-manno-octulosonate cytidylyltransferase (CMP-KDO synthetase)